MVSCVRLVSQSGTSFVFNLIMHCTILFAVLCGIYCFYISKVETDAFNSEIQNQLSNNIPGLLKQYDTTGNIKTILKQLPYDTLKNIYSQPDQIMETFNSGLKRTMIIIIVALFILAIFSALLLYYSCERCLPFWTILGENLITFLFVGMAEALLFYYVFSKFVPAPPSLMVSRIIDDLKNW